ncbi:5'-nucleotidase [Actinokineospora baliensis]|uniref:5'/3'-nucleotidase SurE n=1 Tax=Actinokineospora baliensis TaxID=547056 RepID=UPI00195BD6F9|nr:5'/3'-nucleotidase SurE [Actinokineospora baliensis]MBM7773517.1 5'-nucleotidase [Actinokineospora baliensis]
MAETALVTNDDGIDSPGLHALARAAVRAGLAVTVAAPAAEASGTGAGLTATEDHRHLVVEPRDLPGVPTPALAVSAHPGLIALVGCNGGFGPSPDLVISGINRGANTGRSVLHSGTVGAALTAAVVGISALAFSLDIPLDESAAAHWETVEAVFPEVLAALRDFPPGTVLNVNVPNVPPDQLKPIRWARLAEFGWVTNAVHRLEDGRVELTTVKVEEKPAEGTDGALLTAGHVTVTALSSVSEDPTVHGHPTYWSS